MSTDFATEERGKCSLCGTGIQSSTSRYCIACYRKCLRRCPECTSLRGVVLHKYQVHDGPGVDGDGKPKVCRRCGVPHEDRRRVQCGTCQGERTVFVLPEEKDAKVS